FVQADMSRGRRWAGAGLGLAFAYRVAGAHGGRLVLAPGEGDGTRAELHLPHQARPDAGGQII
ncbi:MAG: two-component sensor histidine kinase, partial [Rhodospirillales bacterium]|nr:two-component sensor histidine kinase [Rhodospirillales bacterium]